AAISRLPTGQAIALVVNAKGVVESRPITTTGVKGQDWIVTDGLQVGDKVIVEGVAKVKEGQEVSAKPYQPQAQKQAPQAAKQPPSADAPKAEQKTTSQV
ncbi:MAG TPA: efflux transporter periplasmic adaptor subunit, partial [Acinetobacter sp.]|nr:efflux transporter periplasmic adaptor subunit [Acinetobacter sp.]